MRLTWKLALLITIGVGAQLLINRHADEIDEAGFALRVFVAHLRGQLAADPELMNMADDLCHRQMVRAGLVPTPTPPATADSDDDIGWPAAVRVNASAPAR